MTGITISADRRQVLMRQLSSQRTMLRRAVASGELTRADLASLIASARRIVGRWQPTDAQISAIVRLQMAKASEMKYGYLGEEFAIRCVYIVEIEEQLTLMLEGFEDAGRAWLHTRSTSSALSGRVPLDLLFEEDLLGCVIVHDYLQRVAQRREARGFGG